MFISALGLVAAVVGVSGAAQGSSIEQAGTDEFLADKTADLVVVAKVEDIESRWAFAEGHRFSMLRVESSVVRVLSGDGAKEGGLLASAHFDYSDDVRGLISPPPILGEEYLLLADAISEDSDWLDALEVGWLAEMQGSHLIRGEPDRRFVYWHGTTHLLADIEARLASGEVSPLSVISDPQARLMVARQRLRDGSLGQPSSFVPGLTALLLDGSEVEGAAKSSEPSEFRHWYEGLAILRGIGLSGGPSKAIVAALRPLSELPDAHKAVAVSVVLAELGDDSGRELLGRTLNDPALDLSSDPESRLMLPGRLPYGESSTKAAAFALGLLGDARGLNHEGIDVRLAAADGLDRAGAEGVRSALLSIAETANRELIEDNRRGAARAEEEGHEYREHYPAQWVKVHQLLARIGSDESLRLLVEANQVDWKTWPGRASQVHERSEIVEWSRKPFSEPSLHTALLLADPSLDDLLARLERLYGDDPSWDDPVLLSVRTSLGAIDAEDDEPEAVDTEDEVGARAAATVALALEIEQMLSSEDPAVRARALAVAGVNQVGEYYEPVLATALEGSGIERQAALFGLSFYQRAISTANLRKLCKEGALSARVSGVELATRRDPGRFADEAMALLHDLFGDEASAEPDIGAQIRVYPRILARFSRSTIPAPVLAGLSDSNPQVRRVVVEALGLGGNPSAVPALRRARDGGDLQMRQDAQWALDRLGPENGH